MIGGERIDFEKQKRMLETCHIIVATTSRGLKY